MSLHRGHRRSSVAALEAIRSAIPRSTRRRVTAPSTTLPLALLVAILLGAFPATAQRRVEVYKARHRAADELLPIAEAAMVGGGTVTLDPGTNALVLIGDRTSVAIALDLLARQDRVARTIVLHHGTRRVHDLSTQGLAIRWRASAGDFRIGNVAPTQRSGDSVAVRADAAIERLSQSLTAQIRVTEGSRSRIETGVSVPYPTVGPSGASTEFVDATKGFEASARILGDGRIEVDLSTFAQELAGAGRIEGTTASTRVALRPGEIVVVGGLAQERQARRVDAGSSARSTEVRDDNVILLRADLE